MNKYFRIFPGMIGLIFAIILLGIGIIKDINKVKIEESCDKITATLSNCIFRKNRALAPHERSAVPLGTDHCPVG